MVFQQDTHRIKDCVKRIIEKEAALLEIAGLWKTCTFLLSYMLDLSPQSLRNVRIHTDVFTGEHLNGVLFRAVANPDPAGYVEGLGYVFATENLDRQYWISEPPIDNWVDNGTYGCRWEDKVINIELARYQLYIENFVATGMVEDIRNSPQKKVVLEIGAGYGALGHHLMNLTNHKLCYIVVDVPLMLLYTGYYIQTHHPEAKIFIYDPDNSAHQNLDEAILDYDLVLIPNHRLSLLNFITSIDYAINTFSMAEMKVNQVQKYIEFIKPRLKQYFFYQNNSWVNDKPLHYFIGDHFYSTPNLNFFEKYIETISSTSFRARTCFFTTCAEVSKKLEKARIKIRLPDNKYGWLSLDTEELLLRASPGQYVPQTPVKIAS